MIDKDNIYKCDCGTSAFVFDADPEDGGISISVWQYGTQPNTRSWRDKWRHIWHIIKTGSPWCDQVILNPETALEFAKDVTEAVHANWKENKPEA